MSNKLTVDDLNHILGNCDCDRLDMNCWMQRSNDPDFLHTLPARQAEAIQKAISEIIGGNYDLYHFGHNPHDETHSDDLNELLDEQRTRAHERGFVVEEK